MFVNLIAIAAGGAIGSVLRYLTQLRVQHMCEGVMLPVGTLVVNILGCLLFGILAALFRGRLPVSETTQLAVLVGVLGGFTTFSSYAWESFQLMNDRQFATVAAYVVISNSVGLLAVWVGFRLTQSAFTAH